jgi:serine/threonine protein kinase
MHTLTHRLITDEEMHTLKCRLKCMRGCTHTHTHALLSCTPLIHTLIHTRMHRANMVHLDIKPANIFVKNLGAGEPTYKLGDLGLVTLADTCGDVGKCFVSISTLIRQTPLSCHADTLVMSCRYPSHIVGSSYIYSAPLYTHPLSIYSSP